MGLRISVDDGRFVTYGDFNDLIVIGRDPEKCNLVFHPDLTVVGREHLALKRVLGRYRLQLNEENPVLVDGQPAEDGQEIPLHCMLQLGPGGPRLDLETMGNAELPSTMVRHSPFHHHVGRETMIRGLKRSQRSLALLSALVIVGLVAAGIWIAKRMQTSVAELDKSVHVLDTTVGKIDEKHDAALREVFAKLYAPPPPPPPKIEETVNRAAPSTYLVVKRDAAGHEMGQGTAWAVDCCTLATNAHVAILFNELKEGEILLARSNSVPPRDVRVFGIEMHPGYDEFQKLVSEYKPTGELEGGQIQRLNLVPACDVALMHVDEPDALAPPLRIASQETIEALKPGDAIAYVGYPMENMMGGGVNIKQPSPTVHIAYITAITDFFLMHRETALNHLIQHSLPAAGGASGSPLLNAEGHVVGIINAGNLMRVATVGAFRRVATGVGVNFGQRVELLQELLEGRASSVQKERLEEWKTNIHVFASLRERLPEAKAAEWISRFHEGKRATKTLEEGKTTDTEHKTIYIARVPIELKDTGHYFILVITEDEKDVRTFVFDEVGGEFKNEHLIVEEEAWSWVSDVSLPEQTVATTVEAIIASKEKGVSFHLYVYRAE